LAPICLNLLPLREGTIRIRRAAPRRAAPRRAASEIAEPRPFGKLLEKIVDELPKIAAARSRLDRLQPLVKSGARVCQRLFKRRRLVCPRATCDFEYEFERSVRLFVLLQRKLNCALPFVEFPLRQGLEIGPDDRAGHDVGLTDRCVLWFVSELRHADEAGQLLASPDEDWRAARPALQPIAGCKRLAESAPSFLIDMTANLPRDDPCCGLEDARVRGPRRIRTPGCARPVAARGRWED
jgi:hypothetical protein